MTRLALATLPNKALQVFVVSPQGSLLSAWKKSSEVDAAWTNLNPFNPDPGRVNNIAVATLPDGRLTLWAIPTAGGLISNCKQTKDTNSPWEVTWTQTDLPDFGILQGPDLVAAGPLSNGALQLFVTGHHAPDPTEAKLFTRWKLSADPDAQWSEWQELVNLGENLALSMTTANLPDKRLVFWYGGRDN